MAKISLTGIKPTGMPHWGNWLGAIGPAIEFSKKDDVDAYYFIADYHALTSEHNAKNFSQYTYEVAATWLALGLDPNQATLYLQSDIPEIMELNWMLACFTSKGLMNRAHSYKARVDENTENGKDPDWGVNMGLYTYPILMACDILIVDADIVPVGSDQLQHVEIARDIANCFNHAYKKEHIKLPEAIVREDTKLVPGLDGRKMSKSYDNHIPLFLTAKKLRKTINKIVTDSTEPSEPKDPDNSTIMDYYKIFATPEQVAELSERYRKGIGWGEAKLALFEVVDEKLQEPRQKYEELMARPEDIREILHQGAAKVRPKAQELLKRLKSTIGII